MQTEFTIAVRTLVEQVCRRGDLVLEFSGGARSLEGIRGHQRVQQSRPETYAAEVPVSRRFAFDDGFLTVSGRIDGVYHTAEGVVIDEIKTTVRDLDLLSKEQYPLHWSQAKAYAALYAAENDLDAVGVQLTYYRIGTGDTREFRETFSGGELAAFLDAMVAGYLAWARTLARWRQTRDGAIRDLDFPFESYRPGQREMAVEIYRAARDGRQLVVQAATGIGKTMAALFPAVKTLAEGAVEKIFYLTARTTGRSAAEQALAALRRSGLRLKAVTLTAKEKICFNPECGCVPDECPFARGHFDRMPGAVEEAFALEALTRDEIVRLAAGHRVCPFEFSLDLSLWADCVICDYNYAFDPRVHLRRFFSESPDPYLFLVDEAHNLVDRSRDMFSAEIEKRAFLDLRKAVKTELPALYRSLGRINKHLVGVRRACEASGGVLTGGSPPTDLYPLLRHFLKTGEPPLASNRPADFRAELRALYFAVSTFLRVAEQFDEAYAVCCQQSGKNLRLKLFCLDPSPQMAEALKRCRSAVFYSATLTPAAYFRQILGCREETACFSLPSPFPAANLGIFTTPGISTLYRNRERTAPEVAEALLTLVSHRRGNYLCFFPSYDYLERVHRRFAKTAPPVTTLLQTPSMSEAERDAFVARFAESPRETLVGFVVMGGIFGEGIDLTGDRLTGAAIVGVGLPGISPERELIRRHFAGVNRMGFEFAYLYPGINRVLQAAGRVIRSESDRGTVLLVDQRYATRRYAALLPAGWRPARVGDAAGLKAGLAGFWGEG